MISMMVQHTNRAAGVKTERENSIHDGLIRCSSFILCILGIGELVLTKLCALDSHINWTVLEEIKQLLNIYWK